MAIRPALLARLRSQAEAVFPDTATAVRKSLVDDGQGGDTETWADRATYACRLVAQSGQEGTEAGRLVAAMTWRCLLPHAADVLPKDRLRIASLTYEVLETDRGQAERLVLAATLKRVS